MEDKSTLELDEALCIALDRLDFLFSPEFNYAEYYRRWPEMAVQPKE